MTSVQQENGQNSFGCSLINKYWRDKINFIKDTEDGQITCSAGIILSCLFKGEQNRFGKNRYNNQTICERQSGICRRIQLPDIRRAGNHTAGKSATNGLRSGRGSLRFRWSTTSGAEDKRWPEVLYGDDG